MGHASYAGSWPSSVHPRRPVAGQGTLGHKHYPRLESQSRPSSSLIEGLDHKAGGDVRVQGDRVLTVERALARLRELGPGPRAVMNVLAPERRDAIVDLTAEPKRPSSDRHRTVIEPSFG